MLRTDPDKYRGSLNHPTKDDSSSASESDENLSLEQQSLDSEGAPLTAHQSQSVQATAHSLRINDAGETDQASIASNYNALMIIFKTMGRSAVVSTSFTFSFLLAFLIKFAALMIPQPGEEITTEDYIAAAGLATSLLSLCATMLFTLLYPQVILMSNDYGRIQKEDPKSNSLRNNIERTLHGAMVLAMTAATPVVVVLGSSEKILIAFGQNPVVAKLAHDFLGSYCLAIYALMLRMCFELTALSHQIRFALMAMALTTFAIGTTFAYLFTFGYLTAEPQDMAGPAYGYMIDAVLTPIFYAAFILFSKTFKDYHFFSSFRLNKDTFEKTLTIAKRGSPTSLAFFIENLGVLSTIIFAGWISLDQQASLSLAYQFYYLALIIILASAQYLASKVSGFVGNLDYELAAKHARYGLLATILLLAVPSAVVAGYPEILTLISGTDNLSEETLAYLPSLAAMIAAMVLLDAKGYGMLSSLRSMQRPGDENSFRNNTLPTMISILCTLTGVGLSYTLGQYTGMEVNGVLLGYLFGLLFRALGLSILFAKETQRLSLGVTPDEETPLFADDSTPPQCNFLRNCWPAGPASRRPGAEQR